MPELPEVETVVRGLRPYLEGHRLTTVEQHRKTLRFPLPERFAARLQGRRVLRVTRRAKYILAELEGDEVLLCHLGMSGRMLVLQPDDQTPPRDKHDHIVLRTDAGVEIRFNDARRFGMMDLVAAGGLADYRLLRDLGPEPLGNEFNGPALARALKGKRTPIKAALLDQRVVAGLGNIYVCEALFHAGLSPRRLASSVQGQRAERLAQAVRAVLQQAIAAGGSSLRDYRQADGELGYFQHAWAVYGREGEPCPDCDCGALTKSDAAGGVPVGVSGAVSGEGIRRLVQSGRSTFYCAARQR